MISKHPMVGFKDLTLKQLKQLVVSSESGDVNEETVILRGERGLLHLCMAIPQRILYIAPNFRGSKIS